MVPVLLMKIALCLLAAPCIAQNINNNICLNVPDNEFVSDPNDCSRFYMCLSEMETSASCPPGMLFDSVQKRCDFEDNVVCMTSVEPEETTISQTTALSTEATSQITTSLAAIIETTIIPNIESSVEQFCANADPTIPNFYPSSTSCEQYYICINRKPFQLSCTEGQYWNQMKRYCDDPETVDCSVDAHPTDLPICPHEGHLFFPHPKICEFFFFCDYGHLTIQMCPFYYHWDSSLEKCVLKNTSDCTKSSISDVKWV